MELGMGEIVLILLVALLVYGGRLPQVAAAVGRSVAELKRGLRSTTDLVRDEIDEIAELDPRTSIRRAWEARPESSTPRDPTPIPPELAVEDITSSAPDEDDEPPTT